MSDDRWIIERADGAQEVLLERPRKRRDGAFKRWAKAPCPPCPNGTERWDFDKHAWTLDQRITLAWVNTQHDQRAEAMPLAVARAIKLIEARQVLGLPATIEVEAQALGIPVEELARRIVAQAEPGVAAEVERIAARAAIRNQQLLKG